MRQPQLSNCGFAQGRGQGDEGGSGQDETDGRAQLREHAEPGLLARRRILGRQQDRPAPLAAQAQPLSEPAKRQQQGRQQADLLMRRQQADGHGRQPHGHQGRHQRRLAPHPVAEMAERQGADGPCEEGDGEGGERRQQRRARIVAREEQGRKHQHRRRGVDVEVEEFDRRADQAGEQHAAGGVLGQDFGHGFGSQQPAAMPARRPCRQADQVPRGFTRFVGCASAGFSGQGWRG